MKAKIQIFTTTEEMRKSQKPTAKVREHEFSATDYEHLLDGATDCGRHTHAHTHGFTNV